MNAAIRKLTAICAIAIGLSSAFTAIAAGFDSSYNVFQGDLNSDGLTDLYVSSSQHAVIPAGDMPLVIGPPVRDFVLRYRGDGSFDLVSSLTATERSLVASWPPSDVALSVRDNDADGHGDLELFAIKDVIAGARDQLVLSFSDWGLSPRQVVNKSSKFQNFHNDLLAAIENPDFFEDAAPYRVVGSEPGSRVYYGSIISAGNFASTSFLMSWCSVDNPNKDCNLSTADPSPCVRTVNLFDENGQYVGTTTRNVCGDYIHVFVYVPGSVTLAKDYSVFDQDAVETKEILDRLQADCSLFEPSADTQQIDGILGGIFGSAITIDDFYTPNSTAHPPAPGDELFNRNDPTFHHYDVRSRLCDISESGCNLIDAYPYSQFGLRAFTYPSARLRPTNTTLDGSELDVFVANPFQLDNPDAYIFFFGRVTQRPIQTAYWNQGVQNVTTPAHWVYPGTITRKLFQEGNSLYVKTHGIGVNQFWCVPDPIQVNFLGAVRGVRMILAAANDRYGAKTFKTLDRQFKDAWRGLHGLPSQAQQSPATQTGPNQVNMSEVSFSRTSQ